MHKNIFLLVALLLSVGAGICCSVCAIAKGKEKVVAKNLDWFCDMAMLVVNQRNVVKKAWLPDAAATACSWISKYGSVTFNPNGVGSPSGGMNEEGLVIEESSLKGTVYPPADNRPAINEIQWIQYQLDNCRTVDEVMATDARLRIVSYYYVSHYFIYDKNGDALTVDALDGNLVYHKLRKNEVQVLTNSTYGQSQEALKTITGFGGTAPVPGPSGRSLDRFCRTADRVMQFAGNDSTPVVDYAFSTLQAVAQPATAWSVVYDVANRAIHLKTATNPKVQSVYFASLSFSCTAPLLAFNINQQKSGDVSRQFTVFTTEMNTAFVQQVVEAWRKDKFALHITDEQVAELGAYPATLRCKQ